MKGRFLGSLRKPSGGNFIDGKLRLSKGGTCMMSHNWAEVETGTGSQSAFMGQVEDTGKK